LAGLPECARELHDSVAIVLRGIALDAWNNSRDLDTAMDAHRLAWQYACDPNLRRQLSEDEMQWQGIIASNGRVLYRDVALVAGHLGLPHALDNVQRQIVPAQKSSNGTGIGCLVVVVILVIFGVIGSCNSKNNSSPRTSDTPPAPSAPTYRVPRSVISTLDAERSAIESERATLAALDLQAEQLGREIERDRVFLDHTSQFAVDTFNSKVERYNALNQKAKIANAAFNEKVANYNAKLRQNAR